MSYRTKIYKDLKTRNERITKTFGSILHSYNELLEMVIILRSQQKKFRRDSATSNDSTSNVTSNSAIHLLEKKISEMQEELTEIYRRKGENAQDLINANRKLGAKETELNTLKHKLEESEGKVVCLTSTNVGLEEKLDELEKTNEHLKDEFVALQTAYNSLESKFRQITGENQILVDRWLEIKQKEADVMNLENTYQQKLKELKLQSQIAEAAKEQIVVIPSPPNSADFKSSSQDSDGQRVRLPSVCVAATIPRRCKHKFDAHDSDVNALKWSPSGKILATGGIDRKIKFWDVTDDKPRCVSRYDGSNGAVMSLEFDSDESLLLSGSNDFAVRIWSLATQRVNCVFNGHSQKVYAAKFMGASGKIVSGSHDRTLRIWDLRARCCFKTLFAGSICNDIITCESGPGASIISGHYDKKLRFWDIRSESPSNEILLAGKITSLDLSINGNNLLCSIRDDALCNFDLRMNKIVQTYMHDNFKIGLDFSRCSFSPDTQFCISGSSEGDLYVWNVLTGKIEAVLSKEHEVTVASVAWHPSGQGLASCDKHKTVCFWMDF